MEFNKIKISSDCNFIKQNNNAIKYIEESLNNSDNNDYMNLPSYKYAQIDGCKLATYDIINKYNVITNNTTYKTSVTCSHLQGELYIYRKHYIESLRDHYILCNIIQHVDHNVFES